MTEEEIIQEICDIEVHDERDWNESRSVTISPEKLAAFLTKHLPHAPEVKERFTEEEIAQLIKERNG